MRSLKAFIVRDDRTIIIKNKRIRFSTFTHDGHRYRAISGKMFLKPTLFGQKGYALYHEGNPEPYDLENENKGIPSAVLNDLYAPALFRILVKAEKNPLDTLLFLLVGLNIILTVVAIGFAAGGI